MTTNPPLTLDEAQNKLGVLPATDLPVALFPVRMETRFVKLGTTSYLCVRVYPDDLHVETHEPELTNDELRWGRHLWEQVWRTGGDPAADRALQDELATRFGPGRAAWIARTLLPVNLEERPEKVVPEPDPLPVLPRFPKTMMRAASWTRAPQVRALPDRWVVLGYRGTVRVLTALGEPIPQSLAAGPDPQAARPATQPDDTITVDAGMAWLVDFEKAVQQGMGLRIPLSSDAEAQTGYDRIVVLGVKQGDAAGSQAASELEDLLTAQHYTDALAFVPQGTPSNNTAEAVSGFAASEPERWTHFQAPNGGPARQESNRIVTAEALGLNPDVFDAVPHAGDAEQANARHANTALWPATWGYFFGHVAGGVLTDDEAERTRRHFIDNVRARGPLPALRVGRQPYGILPVTSLDRYAPATGETFGTRGVSALRTLRDWWRRSLPRVPRVQPAATPDAMAQTLADILGMQPTADHLQSRLALDGYFVGTMPQRAGLTVPLSAAHQQRKLQVLAALNLLGSTATPFGASLLFANAGFTLDGQLAGKPGKGGLIDGPNFIDAIRSAHFNSLLLETMEIGAGSNTVLYLLLRHAMLQAYTHTAYRMSVAAGWLPAGSLREAALVDIHSDGDPWNDPERTLTPLRLLDTTMPGGPSGELIRDRIHTLTGAQHPAAAPLDEMRVSMGHLAGLPVTELDALTREALDLSSHRLDAWVTGLATARLRRLRTARSTGLILGGYGWVENLRATSGTQPVVSPEPAGEAIPNSPLLDAPGNGGYVIAPSLAHASTAAILRSGYMSYANDAAAPFAIDLSSERVRLAQWLLDGVRNGQPLGALLGYRFERSLREKQLAAYIRVFRLLAPFNDLYRLQAVKDTLQAQRTAMVAAYNTARTALTNEINTLNSQISALTSTINTKTSQRTTLQTSVNQLNNSLIPAAQTAVNQATTERDFWAARVNALRKRPPLDEQRMEAEANLASAQLLLNSRVASLNTLTTERTTKQGQINTLTAEINTASSQRSTKQTQLNQKTTQRNTLDSSHAAQLAAHDGQIAGVTQQIQALESEYRQKYTATTSLQAMEDIEVRHVVDGLALIQKWKNDEIEFGTGDLPAAGSTTAVALAAELNALASTLDAVSDLLTAEGVHQLARGNELRAGATLDALAGGETPAPEPEVVTTPRSGIAHTHRIAVLLSGTPAAPAQWPVDSFQRRALAEPALNAWVASLLPDPARVRIDVAYLDPQSGDLQATRTMRLNQFFLSPLDAVYLAPQDGSTAGSPLEELMTYRLMRTRPAAVSANAVVRFTYDEAADWPQSDVGFGAFLEAARAARELLSAARPLDARDLARPEESPGQNPDVVELKQRVDVAAGTFRQFVRNLETLLDSAAAEALDLEAVRLALTRLAWFGNAGTFPRSSSGETVEDRRMLLEQARTVAKDGARRIAELLAAESSSDRAASAEQQRAVEVQRVQIVLGADFRVLPRFQPVNRAELAATFADSNTLQDQDPMAAVTWFQQIAHVRDGAARFAASLSYAEALDAAGTTSFTVGQLPHAPGDRWIALPHGTAQQPTTARVSLVALAPAGFDPIDAVVGLLIDEWVDVVPAECETVGVAFHYDAPGAQAPQSILLAVPPDARPTWDLVTLESIVQETLELARLRSVDAAALAGDPDHGHLLPALYFAFNPAGDTVSTDLSRATN